MSSKRVRDDSDDGDDARDDDDDDEGVEGGSGVSALSGVHPVVALGLAGVSRVGCDSPACGVVCDSALFRCVAELAVERRPIVTHGTTIICISTDPSCPHVTLGKADLVSCAEGYEVGEGWTAYRSKAQPLGYRGLRFWALVGVHYRERRKGAKGSRDVPESALFALVSWNTENGDVVSKTLLLRGSEALPPQFGNCAAAWDRPLVAFVSSEDTIYVASAETGQILRKWCSDLDPSNRFCALFVGDVKSNDGHVKKCVGIARRRQIEWRPLEDVNDVLRSLHSSGWLYFHHPQAVLCTDQSKTVLYDVRSGQKLAQCSRVFHFTDESVVVSRLWTLGDLVQLVEKNLYPSMVEFESGFYLQCRGGSAVRAVPNGSNGLQNKNRFFRRSLLTIF